MRLFVCICFNLTSHIFTKCLDQKLPAGHKLKSVFNMLASDDSSFFVLDHMLFSKISVKYRSSGFDLQCDVLSNN